MRRSPLRGAIPGLLPLLALATPLAAAQDSTSNSSGLPGDSLDPHLLAEQENKYVVDMAAFRSSWGNVYGIAPVVKSSAQYSPTPLFFSAVISAQSMSVDQRFAVAFPSDAYKIWSSAGDGVNDDSNLNNDPGTEVDTSAFVGNQLAVAFAEFSADDPTNATLNFNNIISGVINYETECPSRLYVCRIATALSSPDWTCNLASFGFGGVDSDGYAHVRADDFGVGPCGPQAPVVGQNLYRVDNLGRNPGARNVIDSTGGTDATTRLLQTNTVCDSGFNHTHSPAVQIPSSVTGGLPILIGTAFSCGPVWSTGQWVYGSSSPLNYSTAHLAGASDSRGTAGYSKHTFLTLFGATATHGTGAVLGTDAGTNRLQQFGLDSNGVPVGAISRALPNVLTDAEDGWQSDALGAGGSLRFNNYFSQQPFRGGNGQVAIGKDQQGRLIAAAAVDHPNGASNSHPNNLIAVVRTNSSGVSTWGIAGYVENGNGKAVYNVSGTEIGHLFTMETLTGGTTVGPSISSPMIDSVGNIYFVSPVSLDSGTDGVGLIRAVYDESDLSYRLELILLSGDEFHGQNTDLDYQVQFIPIADSNSIDSSAPFSSNINQDAHNGLDPAGLSVSSSETLGAIALNAAIVYDVNGDGLYERLANNPATLDQEYNVVLMIGHADDCNQNGIPDDVEIKNGDAQDTDGDGVPDDCAAGTPYCFGDGGGTPCPCGNNGGPGEGCANSTGPGGVVTTLGSTSVIADDLAFHAFNLRQNQPGLLFVGTNAVNGGSGNAFGDGLRCAGQNVVRLGVDTPDAQGTADWGPGLGGQGGWTAGDTRYFQVWYRDPNPASPCGSGFNLTNGIQIDFQP